MAQMPALIPKEVEIQRLKKIWMIIIAMGSIAASVEVDNFVDGSLHQTSISTHERAPGAALRRHLGARLGRPARHQSRHPRRGAPTRKRTRTGALGGRGR